MEIAQGCCYWRVVKSENYAVHVEQVSNGALKRNWCGGAVQGEVTPAASLIHNSNGSRCNLVP